MKLRRGALFAIAILIGGLGLLRWGVTPGHAPTVATTSTRISTSTSTPSATQTWTSTPSEQTPIGTPTVPAPKPGAMTVYAVTNPNASSIVVRQIITDSISFRYEFTSTVAANSTIRFHLRDLPNVPSPFTGGMTLLSDDRFSAAIIAYDYPSP